jgi:hypothetical protein
VQAPTERPVLHKGFVIQTFKNNNVSGLTISTEQSPSGEAVNCAATQEFPNIL